MKDFATWPRETLIFFEPGDRVRYHLKGNGTYHEAEVIRTARTRVLIRDIDYPSYERWVPNLWLSHLPEFYGRKG